MTALSQHFTLLEMTGTDATNIVEAEPYVASLTALCTTLLEPVRARFGPVSVHSGFRGPALNARVKGNKASQHLKGEAVDFHCPGAKLEDVMRWIVYDSGLKYGQVILEGRRGPPTWIHLSLGQPFRVGSKCQQALVTTDGVNYSPYKG